MPERLGSANLRTKVQAQARMLYALVDGPLSFAQWCGKTRMHPSTLLRHVPVLLRYRMVITIKDNEEMLTRQIFALGESPT